MKRFILSLTASLLSSTAICSISYAETATKLPEIKVTADSENVEETTAGPVKGIRALTAKSATKTDTPLEQVPQNIQVIPRQLIENQSAVSVSEAVKNASNVIPMDTRSIGNVEQVPLRIRGFGADLWTDGFPGNTFVVGDREGLANVERIEILKGPNAILYGGGGGAPTGGTINVVSKLPEDEASYEVGGTFGSYSYWSPNFDFNQPLNAQKTALFRLTGEYTRADNYIDVLETKRFNINPTLTLTNREDTTLTLQGFVSHHRQQAYPGLPVEGTLFGSYRVNPKLYFGDPDIEPTYANIQGVVATLDHKLDEVWSANLKARWSESELDQLAQFPLFDATFTGGTPVIAPSTFDVNSEDMFDKQREFSITPSIQAKFNAGPSKNTLLFGGDYSRVKEEGYMNVDSPGDLVDLSAPSFPPFARPQPGDLGFAQYFDYDATYVTKGLFAQLQSTLYDRVHLLGGVRLSSIDVTYEERTIATTFVTDKTKLLPRGGVVVDLVEGLSAYASYSEGMKWVPFSQTFAQPAPELSQTKEAGFKFNLDDKLTGTLAVFEIERQDVPYTIGLGVGALSNQTSRGFEADMIYQPDDNWSLTGSYGYTDAYFEDATATVPADNKISRVPANSGRLWVNYKFDPDVLKGWSIGAGGYASSGQYVDDLNRWKTDSYVTFDAKVGWENETIRAAVTVKNLTGEDYYTPYTWFGGQVAPGAPRAVYGQISYKFK